MPTPATWLRESAAILERESRRTMTDQSTPRTAEQPRTAADQPYSEPVFLHWSEHNNTAEIKGWGGDDIYRCRECPEWEGDTDSAPRHSSLHERAATGAKPDLLDVSDEALVLRLDELEAQKQVVHEEVRRRLAASQEKQP